MASQALTQPAVLTLVSDAPVIRKFDTADFSTHGSWLVPRMVKTFPHMDERMIATYLQNILYNNEHLFLFSSEGVALAQLVSGHPLEPKPVIQERFVWVKDPDDAAMKKHAGEFYTVIGRWAKPLGVQAILVEENTDVPHDIIKEKLGRIFSLQKQFARV